MAAESARETAEWAETRRLLEDRLRGELTCACIDDVCG